MRSLLFIFFFCLIVSTVHSIDLSTCARMNTRILSKGAQALCITSCSIQNCGTGYCEKRSGRPTCVCARCANGGNVPLDALINKGRK